MNGNYGSLLDQNLSKYPNNYQKYKLRELTWYYLFSQSSYCKR